MNTNKKEYSYITVLSNWLISYDRYKKVFSKQNNKNSTFPNEFYLLKNDELSIGFNKASKLLQKLNIKNNLIIRITSIFNESEVNKNIRNNLGWYVNQNYLNVNQVYIYIGNADIFDDNWKLLTVEDITALSLSLEKENKFTYEDLKPLTLSFLPVGVACQAKCKFCFSKSSISKERIKKINDFSDLDYWLDYAKRKGANRFVITGGGEPGLFGYENIKTAIDKGRNHLGKVILITNGLFITKNDDDGMINQLIELKKVGLNILSLSMHHHSEKINTEIMGIKTDAHRLIDVASKYPSNELPTIRLVCVLQKGGVESINEIEEYIKFAVKNKISQICFKELYVSATTESMYSEYESNIYSLKNQVSLKEVIKYAESKNLKEVSKLAWGAPIYLDDTHGSPIQIAAYTEPNVGWELQNKIARSWNYMADNNCYASLEDNKSKIMKEVNI